MGAQSRRVARSGREGAVVFLTGLPAAGKSTLARALAAKLREDGRVVTVLDGDSVRRRLSPELGFSKEHRDLNVQRIGFVAAEVARHGGVAVCAAVAPYDAARQAVRRMVEETGAAFLLVHVATPLDVCEARDPKGLYARARSGLLNHLTGIDDPYEPPPDADVVVDTTASTPADCVDRIVAKL